MGSEEAGVKPAIVPAEDRGEAVVLMEPLRIGEASSHRAALGDLVVDLAAKAAGFRCSLPVGVHTALASVVRAMNCYYSNLIEGHDTHPVDIERALKNDYSTDPEKRDLQLEARAHIEVQEWMDGGGLIGRAATREALCEIHERFYGALPEQLRTVEDPKTKDKVARRLAENSDRSEGVSFRVILVAYLRTMVVLIEQSTNGRIDRAEMTRPQ
jgi:hypothetical protein